MISSLTRIFAALMLVGFVSACEQGMTGPMDDASAEPMGEAIASPTDGVANEVGPN